MSVNLTFQDGTAILTIENPPLNLISAEVRAGLLRAMADDYGALAVLEALGDGPGGGEEVVGIHLLESRFAEGRRFDLVDQV